MDSTKIRPREHQVECGERWNDDGARILRVVRISGQDDSSRPLAVSERGTPFRAHLLHDNAPIVSGFVVARTRCRIPATKGAFCSFYRMNGSAFLAHPRPVNQ